MTQDNQGTPLNEAFVVTRSIPVRTAARGSLATAAGRLRMHPGVALVTAGEDGRLTLRYDTSRIGFEEIEQVLDEAGVARPASLVWRIKSEWFRFTDGNARANAHTTHACCSRPPVPPGGGRK